MPRREDLAAAVSRELRAAVATQRRKSSTAGVTSAVAADLEPQQRRSPSEPAGHQRQLRWRAVRQAIVPRWLYPLAERDRTRDTYAWNIGGRRRKRVTLEDFKKLLLSGRLKYAPWCGLATNGRRVKTGDFVYVYANDADAGIVGFATVTAMRTPSQGGPAVQLHIDIRLSERLVKERPVPAAALRRWLRPRKRPVENLTTYSHRLDLMLSRYYSHEGHVRRASGLSESGRRSRVQAQTRIVLRDNS
jgi:hypothetical protein